MHSAPSVSYPVGRSLFQGGMLIAVWLAGALTAVWWWATQPGTAAWRLSVMVAALVVAGVAAGISWWRAPTGTLAWDGESWILTAASLAQSGTLEVGLDLQRVLVLHWSGVGTTRWLWLDRSTQAPRWGDLRRAVYSRATPQAPLQAGPPAANS